MEHVCGRPLGLKFDNRTCELYIADAYFGLLRARRGGRAAERVAPGYGGAPFKLTNALDIDTDTGEVYFTDSSRFFQRRYNLICKIHSNVDDPSVFFFPQLFFKQRGKI